MQLSNKDVSAVVATCAYMNQATTPLASLFVSLPLRREPPMETWPNLGPFRRRSLTEGHEAGLENLKKPDQAVA
jgi:hypothetical protein